MNVKLIILFLLLSFTAFTQKPVKAIVRDAGTKEPLAFCNVTVKETSKGTITNADGVFSIQAGDEDVLVFSFIGYEPKPVSVARLMQNPVVFLVKKDFMLQEVTVLTENDYLYGIMEKCRKNMQGNHVQKNAKSYYSIDTQIGDRPAELLECYYNAYINGYSVNKLLYKNGRIGLAVIGNRLYKSMETSKAMIDIDLAGENYASFPLIPFQCSEQKMKKLFRLTLKGSDSLYYDLLFEPAADIRRNFSGEAWIDRKNFSLSKITLTIEDAAVHPFWSLWGDSISNVSMDITQVFRQDEDGVFPGHILFNYKLTYHSGTGIALFDMDIPEKIRDIRSCSILYLYDYDRPFILPYFEYDSDSTSDYSLISMIPYNEFFWNNNNKMLLTDEQVEKLGFFSREGSLTNYREGNYGKDFLSDINYMPNGDSLRQGGYKGVNYTFWYPDRRIRIIKDIYQCRTYPVGKILNCQPADLFSIRVQILMDVTQAGDSLDYRTYTVFDEPNTWYHYPVESYTNVFFNIYFDICEIERRKLEQSLKDNHASAGQINEEYIKADQKMAEICRKYLKEVKMGENREALEKWNAYVHERLGIDNIRLFEGKTDEKQ